MGDGLQDAYNNDASAVTYYEWSSHGLFNPLCEHVNLQFFGDLTGKKIVEFGCGNGSFLKKCLTDGASSCLGFDVNASMIGAGGNIVADNRSDTHGLHFLVQDVFKPIAQHHGQFDFAVCQWMLYYCTNETELETFYKNAFDLLKPGGKMFCGLGPYVTNTLKDSEIIADLLGVRIPMRSDAQGRETFFHVCKGFRPASPSVSKTGRPFTREQVLTFPTYHWSREIMMKYMEKVGFVNVRLLPLSFPDEVSPLEKEQIKSLEETLDLLGGEKS